MHLPNLLDAKKRIEKETIIKYDDYEITPDMEVLGKDKKYHIITYGCQMNVHDSENISAIMEDMKYLRTEDMNEADVIILNTCAIRENAHNKVSGMLGRIKHLKQDKKDLIVVFMGCMAQEEVVVTKLKDKYKFVDIIIGTHNIHKLPLYLYNRIKNKEREIEVFSCEGNVYENIPVRRDSKIKALVNIMYGCDKFCTYCIVPYTRGRQRSRMPEDIINECEELYNNNYQEVTLLGQNVNAYGKDLNINYNMANLLSDVAKIGIPRIRFVTSHPWDFTSEMIDVIASYPNIMPYIHLPIQSGSDRILKLMGRKYTTKEYLELVSELRKKIPNVTITTDIIVGFPGETEEDFQKTLDIVNEVKYDLAYTFIFSKRVGTPACKLEDNTPLSEKEERLQRLNELINNYARISNDKMLGKTLDVLIEGPSDKKNKFMGYTDTMKLVNVKCDEEFVGKIIKVKITDTKTWSLEGEIVNE